MSSTIIYTGHQHVLVVVQGPRQRDKVVLTYTGHRPNFKVLHKTTDVTVTLKSMDYVCSGADPGGVEKGG